MLPYKIATGVPTPPSIIDFDKHIFYYDVRVVIAILANHRGGQNVSNSTILFVDKRKV